MMMLCFMTLKRGPGGERHTERERDRETGRETGREFTMCVYGITDSILVYVNATKRTSKGKRESE
jgi:hypothetical protein